MIAIDWVKYFCRRFLSTPKDSADLKVPIAHSTSQGGLAGAPLLGRVENYGIIRWRVIQEPRVVDVILQIASTGVAQCADRPSIVLHNGALAKPFEGDRILLLFLGDEIPNTKSGLISLATSRRLRC